nr:hypothetical protein [Tanacetum cinerariifolium]
MGCDGEIDDMLRIRLCEAGSNEEIFTYMAWIRSFNFNEPIYVELCHEFYSTYEFDEVCADDELQIKKIIKFRLGGCSHNLTLLEFARRLGLYQAIELDEEGINVYFEGGLHSDEHFNAQEYWLSISREENLGLSRSHTSTIMSLILRVINKMVTYGLCQRTTGLFKAWQLKNHSKNSLISSKPDRAHICIINDAIRGTATISPVQTNPIPITTTMFAATTLENTPIAYRDSTSANPNPVISLAFIEAIYEALESLLRDRRAQSRGESRAKRNTKGGRHLEEAPSGNGGQSVNLPLILTAHLGRGENGKPFQSSLTSVYRDLPSTYKGLMEKTYTWVKAREVATDGILNNRMDDFERSKKFSWGNSIGQKDRGRFSPYEGQNHKLLSNLVKSPKEILAKEKVAKTFEQPPRFPGANCQIRAARSPGKRVKEKKEKTTGTRLEERKKEEKKPTLNKVSVLIISGKNCNMKKRHANHDEIWEITIPPLPNVCSSDPVISKVYISGRQVNRAYLDGGSSCEVIHEHFFLKLKPSIRSLRVDSNTPLFGFLGEQSWPLGEIPLEVTIGEGLIAVTKTLTFVIVKSDSPYNLLLGRTTMQQMGIVVSTVYEAIKFYMPRGIGTIFAKYNSHKPKEEEDVPTNKYQGNEKNVLSCIDTEERMVIHDKHPEHKITIGRQLPTRIKIRLHDLLKRYIDVFTWTSTHITGVPRVLMIGGEAFNTEHRINVFNHVEPVKQKKRSLALERNEEIHSYVEELIEAGILNMEVNADDMAMKSDFEEEMMADIIKTLERIWAINLKLNPKKCSFRVEEGIYLGHLITKQGIRAEPSKSMEKTPPFMKTLKSCTSGKMVQWTKEVDESFRRMKEYLESLPMMVISTKGETQTMYLVTSEENRRLGKVHQAWINELPQVLWAHRTMPKSSNGETPFSLVYGSEPVIPIEISVETKRVQDFDPKENDNKRREDLDILEERREMASIKEAHYKQKLEGYHNKNVKPSTFKPGTYVFRLNSASKEKY